MSGVASPAQAADHVHARLRALARHAGGFDATRYFRGTPELRFHNVATPAIRALARDVVRAHPAWTLGNAMALAEVLMPDPHLETKAVAIEVVERYRRQATPPLLPHWKRWLADDLAANWATTDLLCGRVIGPFLVDAPACIDDVCTWHSHRNLWVRRASAVALLPAIRRGLVLDQAYAVALALHADPHDLMHKAVGWLLREVGKRDADRLAAYLRTHGPAIPRTTVRYAIERFAPEPREALLRDTR